MARGYLSSLHLKAFTYINLDKAVLGTTNFKVSASPLLYKLIEKTMQDVKHPVTGMSLYQDSNWVNKVEKLSLIMLLSLSLLILESHQFLSAFVRTQIILIWVLPLIPMGC